MNDLFKLIGLLCIIGLVSAVDALMKASDVIDRALHTVRKDTK